MSPQKKTGPGPVRVFIVDDHPIVREGLRKALSSRKSIIVVGEASDGKTALDQIPRVSPDIVFLDITLNGLSGIDVARRIRKRMPSIRLIIFTVHEDKQYILELAKLGVRGYLLKESSREEIVRAVEAVYAGEVFFSGTVSQAILSQYVNRYGSKGARSTIVLTEREGDVLKLIAEGLKNREIARILNVGIRTVQSHRGRIMHKLDIHSASGLTKYAVQRGIVSIER